MPRVFTFCQYLSSQGKDSTCSRIHSHLNFKINRESSKMECAMCELRSHIAPEIYFWMLNTDQIIKTVPTSTILNGPTKADVKNAIGEAKTRSTLINICIQSVTYISPPKCAGIPMKALE